MSVKSQQGPPPLVTYLKWAWLVRIHCAGIEIDCNMCDLSDYCAGMLSMISRQSRQVAKVGTLETSPDFRSVCFYLDEALDHFLELMEFRFGTNIDSFIDFVMPRSPREAVHSGMHQVGKPFIQSTIYIQEAIDDIFLAHCLREGFHLPEIARDLRLFTLRVPHGIMLPLETPVLTEAIPSTRAAIKSLFSDILEWLDARSAALRRQKEEPARRQFLHLVAFISLGVLPVEGEFTFGLLLELLTHHDIFPRPLRALIGRVMQSSSKLSAAQIRATRAALLTNADVARLTKAQIFAICARQRELHVQ